MAHTDGIRAFRLSMNALKLLEKVKRRETETMFVSFQFLDSSQNEKQTTLTYLPWIIDAQKE